MQIELRRVSYSATLSQETSAFTADIWVDGRKAGSAENHGTGGCTNIHPHALQQRLDEHGKTLPQVDIGSMSGGAPSLIAQDGEWIVGRLLDDWILLRDLRKRLKNRVLYTRSDKPGIFTTKVLRPGQQTQILGSAEIKGKWNVATFLNSLPEAEALAFYRAG